MMATVHVASEWFDPIGSRTTTVVRYPAVVADMIPAAWDPADVFVALGDERLEPDAWDRALEDGDTLNVVLVPAIEGVAAFVIKAIIYAAVSASISYAIAALQPSPDNPNEQQRNQSQTYGWSGLRTVYDGIGLPAPFALGEHDLAGVAVQQWVETRTINGRPTSILNVLLLLCGPGPVGEIGGYTSDVDGLSGDALPVGMRIEGNAATNYDGVTVSLRFGSQEQDPIPGFNQVRNVFAVALPIDNVAAGDGSPTTDFSDAAAYDMTVAGDSCIVTISADALYRQGSSGGLNSETVTLQVRYVELASGVPTGSYVTLPAFNFTSASVSAVTYDYAFDFFDPATYTAPAVGDATDIPGTRTAYKPTQLVAPEIPGGSWTYDDFVDEMSIELFVDVSQSGYRDGPLISWGVGIPTNDEPGQFNLAQAIVGFVLRSYTTSTGVVVALEGGEGSTLNVGLGGSSNGTSFGRLDESGLNQVGISYAADPLGDGLNRWRLIVNGAVVDEAFSITRLQIPPAGTTFDHYLYVAGWAFGRFAGGPSTSQIGGARFDQCVIWARELDSFEWGTRWRSGLGTYENSLADKVAVWRFESLGSVTDASGNGNNLTYDGTGAESVVTGYLADGSANDPKQSTYRVEVQRTDNVEEDDRTRDKVEFAQIQVIRYDEIAYSGFAMAGVRIEATEQLNTSRPTVTFRGKWSKGYEWDRNDPKNPSYAEVVTSNPAWLTARYLLDPVQGMGSKFTPDDIDWQGFASWADDCDVALYDGRGERQVIIHSWQSVSGVDTMRIEFSFGSTEAWPSHWTVGTKLGLYGATASAPAWAVTLIDDNESRAYEIVDGPFASGSTQGYVDVAWPSDLVTPPPTPTQWFPQAVGDDVFVRGVEELCRADIVFDERSLGGWDGALQIARCGRAQLVRVGRKIRPRVMKARPVTHVFNGKNIDKGSWTLTPVARSEQFDQATADILDRERNYQRVPITRSTSDLDGGELLANPTAKSFELRGITRRSQAIRDLDLMLRTARDVGMFLEFTTGLSSLLIESGDVAFVTLPTTEWASSGIVDADAANAQSLPVDRETTLAAATTYQACVQSADDDRLYYATVSSGAGTYAAGAVLAMSGDFTYTDPDDPTFTLTHTPQAGDRWIVGISSSVTRTFEVLDVSLAPNFRRELRLAEYVGSVYVDLPAEDQGDQERSSFVQPPATDLPPAVSRITVEDGTRLDPETGALRPALWVAWSEARTGAAVGRGSRGPTEVYVAPAGAGALLAATVDPGRASVTVEAPWIQPGQEYEVTVRPTTAAGAGRSISRCTTVRHRLVGSVPLVDAPASVGVEIVGDRAIYFAEPAAGLAYRGLPIELRRGPGWALAHRIGTVHADAGSTLGPTADWATLPTSGAGLGDPTIVARHRLPSGAYGAALELAPSAGTEEAGAPYRSVSIEDDWTSTGDAAAPVAFDGLAESGGILSFSGSALSASYTSGVYSTGLPTGQARRTHVSADYVAWQVPPWTMEQLDFSLGSKRAESWTLEGPLDPSDPLFGACTVEQRLVWTASDSTPTNEQRFRPCDLVLKNAQIKLVVTRPTDAWDVEIERLALRLEPVHASDVADILDGGSY